MAAKKLKTLEEVKESFLKQYEKKRVLLNDDVEKAIPEGFQHHWGFLMFVRVP